MRDNCIIIKEIHIITEMEKIADKIGDKFSSQEGSVRIAETAEQYKQDLHHYKLLV